MDSTDGKAPLSERRPQAFNFENSKRTVMNAFKINKSEDTRRKEFKKVQARWRPSCVREEAESAREGAVNKETIDSA